MNRKRLSENFRKNSRNYGGIFDVAAEKERIAELEAELRGPLFHRLGRKVVLTDAGAALVGPARAALREIDAARQVVADVNGLVRGRQYSSICSERTAPYRVVNFIRQAAFSFVTI